MTDLDATDLDATLGLLADRRRRRVLGYLGRHEGPVPLDDLATELARTDDDGRQNERRDAAVGLIHKHLPKLEAELDLRYDEDRGTVELGSLPGDVAAFLRLAESFETDAQAAHPGGDERN